MQHRNVAYWFLRVIGFVGPSINSRRLRMPVQIEYLNDSFPYRLALKRFFHRHAFNMGRFHAMQFSNHGLQFLDMAHYSFSAFFLDAPASYDYSPSAHL